MEREIWRNLCVSIIYNDSISFSISRNLHANMDITQRSSIIIDIILFIFIRLTFVTKDKEVSHIGHIKPDAQGHVTVTTDKNKIEKVHIMLLFHSFHPSLHSNIISFSCNHTHPVHHTVCQFACLRVWITRNWIDF